MELDEIESVLCLHDAIAEAGSFAPIDELHGAVIEAAVVTRDDMQLDERTLLRHCAAHLPAYARPRRITILKQMPRTRTGKIDRTALLTAATLPPESEKNAE